MKSEEMELARRENYLINATVKIGENSTLNIPCKVFLPERFGTLPYLIFKPDNGAYNAILDARLSSSLMARFPATMGPPESAQWMTITAPEMWVRGATTRYWGEDLTERTIYAEPQDLHIARSFPPTENCDGTQISFVISSNRILKPSISRSMAYTGTVEHKRLDSVMFDLDDSHSVTMDEEFQYRTLENDDLLQWSELVAIIRTTIPAVDSGQIKSAILPALDDLLLIASMVARQRFVCLGWRAYDRSTHTTFYRGNYTFPESTTGTDFNHWMVDMAKAHDFIRSCYTGFLGQSDRLALRGALHALVPIEEKTIEASILSLFAGLEALVLSYRRQAGQEFVMENEVWGQLRTYIEQSIKSWKNPGLTKEQRGWMYKKLTELNRVPLSDAFTGFCQTHAVIVHDLWPIFSTKKYLGLADIRNRLIHGDPFPTSYFDALSTARLHLERILERAIVTLLGGDIGATKIGLRHRNEEWVQSENFELEAARLSSYVNGEVA